jgi:AraC-like DNA-binding protein/mannose-6-phosphate isomerase-like protein (cupin superfamily)
VLRHNISALRQGFITQYDPGRGVLISTLAYEYPRGFRVHEHSHGSDQLIYAISGVMEVSADQSVWLIPPHFAIWIPARTTHTIKMPGAVSMRTLYMRCGLAAGLPPTCTVFHVTPLLRELIVETVRLKELRIRDRLHCALRDLLVSQLETASPMPTSVTRPKDPRARAIADTVIGNPAERQSLAAMCASAGASVRTIQRVFRREVGSDFESWRRQVRLVKAVELLVSGRSVKEASFALGYRQPTAFVEMFRGVLGATPGAWIQALQRLN